MIGLDVHDVGGYINNDSSPDLVSPERDQRPGLNNLRTARDLIPNMIITIEPGIYFRDFLLNGELDRERLNIDLKYLNIDKIREYQKEVGGIRIEDVVLITETGCELLSKDVPRTVQEIEDCMSGKQWR